jgi:hypothetical protein
MYINKNFTINENGFVEIPISEAMIEEAKIKAKDIGILTNSIRKGEGNVVGCIGQLSVLSAITEVITVETYDYDLLTTEGKRIEVKTKDRTVIPRPHYECSIAASNPNQTTDLYIFVSTHRNGDTFKNAYILGYMCPSEYYNVAKFMKKGDLDPSNNFYVKADCYNVAIKDLNKFKKGE